MKLTIVVQGVKGSRSVPALDAQVFLVRGMLIDGQEVTAKEVTLDCTPNSILSFVLRDASPLGDGWTPEQLDLLWEVEEGTLKGSPIEIEFREAPQ